MTNTHDVVVVGGGLGGLLAANRMASGGRRVVVLEQASHPGGLARSPAASGEALNLGPHALYRSGRAVAVLRELGVPLDGFVPGPGAFFEHDQHLLPGPTSALGLLTLPWLSWRERVELAWSMREVLAGPSSPGTLDDWLAQRRSPRVRGFFSAMARVSTYTNAPIQLSARVALAQVRAGLDGVLYLDGGWQHLVDVLASRVEVRCATRVHALEGTDVHCENGDVLRARDVVLAVPLAAAARLAPQEEGLVARVPQLQPVRAACVDLVLQRLPRPERRLVLGFDAPTYFSVHSRPEQLESVKVHVAWYLAPGDETSAEVMEQRLDAFLERVQPGWRDVVLARRYFPHMRVMEDLPGRSPVTVSAPLHLVSGVGGFLFDAIALSTDALVARPMRAAAR